MAKLFLQVFSAVSTVSVNSFTEGGENYPTNDVKPLIMHITKQNISKPFN